MMGFVAALSSSIAFIVLIMSAQLLNLINVRAVREQEAQSIQISEAAINRDTNILVPGSSVNSYSYYLSRSQIQSLIRSTEPVNLYCTYGNNFSLDVAKKITAYNYILLRHNLSELEVNLSSPKYNKSTAVKDSCFLTVTLK